MTLFCSASRGIFLLRVVNRAERAVSFGIARIVSGHGAISNKESCISLICCFVCFSNAACLASLTCFARSSPAVFRFLVVIVPRVSMVIDFAKPAASCSRRRERSTAADGAGRAGGASCTLSRSILAVACWTIEPTDWKVSRGARMTVRLAMVSASSAENPASISSCLYAFRSNVRFIHPPCGIAPTHAGAMCPYS